MDRKIHKTIRRKLLLILYGRYLKNPVEMIEPVVFMEEEGIDRNLLVVNMHYLADRNLVELMLGYNPPMFVAARITTKGIDLVENRFEFERLFPESPESLESGGGDIPELVELLAEEADYCDLGGAARRTLLRDINFLRGEIDQPANSWRMDVIQTALSWIEASIAQSTSPPEILSRLRQRLTQLGENGIC